MSARTDILTKLRANQREDPKAALPSAIVKPALQSDLLGLFMAQAEANSISLDRAAQWSLIPAALAKWLDANQLEPSCVVARQTELEAMAASTELQASCRELNPTDLSYVSLARCAVAETGSVMMLCGPLMPAKNHFLPENLIVVVKQQDIVAHLEDAYDIAQSEAQTKGENGLLSRAVNLISGPSKTADIEQTIVYGAHGPKRMHLILLAN